MNLTDFEDLAIFNAHFLGCTCVSESGQAELVLIDMLAVFWRKFRDAKRVLRGVRFDRSLGHLMKELSSAPPPQLRWVGHSRH